MTFLQQLQPRPAADTSTTHSFRTPSPPTTALCGYEYKLYGFPSVTTVLLTTVASVIPRSYIRDKWRPTCPVSDAASGQLRD
jgi:hypothetical protein